VLVVTINKELLRGSNAVLLLSMLSRESMYGYQIIKEISRQSGGVFDLKEGTLYTILHALEAEGSVASYWQESNEGRRRKYYRITAQGIKLLSAKKAEWSQFKQAVDQVIGGMRLEPATGS
jgi:PadR family transcriptional regulator PadR